MMSSAHALQQHLCTLQTRYRQGFAQAALAFKGLLEEEKSSLISENQIIWENAWKMRPM